ncbi:MAG: hypothetical protein QOI10_3800 [Solirubrobacterales bacterium]|jgi:hypothetical protein|nr:hypothetical protein [Solirubrobacterales bacterium]
MAAHEVLTRADATRTLDAISPRLYKLRSWLHLHQFGVPTLRGIVVDGWSREEEQAVRDFGDSMGTGELLLRSDRVAEMGKYPRGGSIVSLAELPGVVVGHIRDGRVVFLLEPVSPFSDLYSVNSASWPSDEFIIHEIVGPGFDASDLKRGDDSPHERYVLTKSRYGPIPPQRLEHYVIGSDAYRSSWMRRAAKVGQMLLDGGFRPASVGASLQEVAAEGLSAMDEVLLLEHRDSYRAVPCQLIESVHDQVMDLRQRLQGGGLPGEPFALSMSYVGPGARPVYWDIVWPRFKYEGDTAISR